MSTPTDQFAGLSIQEMVPTSEELNKRAIELQDILSIFDETNFPSEFQLPVVKHITRSPADRPPPDQWIDITNLYGTLLTLGCWDDGWWDRFAQLDVAKLRATAFTDKLRRRFRECFDAYELLLETPQGADELKKNITDIARRILVVFEATYVDQNTFRIQEAETRESDTLQITLEALQTICSFAKPVIPVASTGGTARRARGREASMGDPHLSLFGSLIRGPGNDMGAVLLDTLEQFTGPALNQHKNLLVLISGLLDNLGNTPTDFVERFDALQEKANDESAVSKLKSAPGGRKRGLEPDPKIGSLPEVTPKRGKRSGGR